MGARIIRISRVFRVMRLLRLFRLFRFFEVLKAKLKHQELSEALGEHMQKMTLLTTFIHSHLHAEGAMIKFFGLPKANYGGDLVHCLLQSQVAVYKAIVL